MSLTSQAETAGQSLPVVLSPPRQTLGAQHSQLASPGHLSQATGLSLQPSSLAQEDMWKRATLPKSPYPILTQPQGGVRDSKTHKLGTSRSPGLLRRQVFHRLDVYGFKRPEYYSGMRHTMQFPQHDSHPISHHSPRPAPLLEALPSYLLVLSNSCSKVRLHGHRPGKMFLAATQRKVPL